MKWRSNGFEELFGDLLNAVSASLIAHLVETFRKKQVPVYALKLAIFDRSYTFESRALRLRMLRVLYPAYKPVKLTQHHPPAHLPVPRPRVGICRARSRVSLNLDPSLFYRYEASTSQSKPEICALLVMLVFSPIGGVLVLGSSLNTTAQTEHHVCRLLIVRMQHGSIKQAREA